MAKSGITCLLVDDEPALLRVFDQYLTRVGYLVTPCASAGAALEKFNEDPPHFQLLITDLTLPDMPGHEMALQMTGLSPDLRVLLCSGYPFEVASLPRDVQSRFRMLVKPFTPRALADELKRLMP